MVTIFEATAKYAQENNLPAFNRNQLSHIGNFVSTHFKRFWGPAQSPEVIAQAGFVCTKEEGQKYLVVGYPDCFLPEIYIRIKTFLDQKKENLEKLNLKSQTESQLPPVIRRGIPANAPEIKGEKKRKRVPIR